MKKNFLTFLFAATLAFNSFAGVWVGTLTCMNNSGDTVLTANFEDMISLRECKLVMEKTVLNFSYKDNDFVISDPTNKVFTFSVKLLDNGNNKTLLFWAIPSSFKNTLSEEFHKQYIFQGKFKRPDNIEMEINCTLDYEL